VRLGIDANIILEWTLNKQGENVDCIQLAKDKVLWRALVNGVMKTGFTDSVH
jgi:hypothetical protein